MTGPGRSIGAEPNAETDRGVTEVLAFILVFATILGSVALLYTTGFSAMNDYQQNEQLNNADRAMISLADNFNDVLRYDGVDRRYGELTLRGGTIRTGGESTTLHVWTGDKSDGHEEIELGSLRYEAGSDSIAYESGGVFRASGDGSVDRKRPPIRCHTDTESETAVVSILHLEDDGERSIQSSDGVGFTIEKEETLRQEEIDGIDSTDGEIRLEIVDSPYQNGWERALERNGWEEDENNDDVYECTGVEDVEIQLVTAEIEY